MGTECVLLTVQAFTVVLGEYREGDRSESPIRNKDMKTQRSMTHGVMPQTPGANPEYFKISNISHSFKFLLL